jgi:hypothetical protein
MNYFRCTVGGSGGKLKLTVTCTNVFAGLTITCTDGTTTLTKTCPSASPYTVVFNIPNGGTWTISGVYGGKTNTTTVVIPDTATLNYIPTGSTVTPVNDIQTWLHCANIWDKSYTTINQVLVDTSTLLALISSNNAADYMARSTNWASSVCANQTAMGYIGNNNYCANKLLANTTWLTAIGNSTYFESVLNSKVATMTSNNTPSGYVTSASSNYDGNYAAYKAFDGNDSTSYLPASSDTQANFYLKVQFPNAINVRKVTMKRYANSGNAVTLKLQYSTDDNTWVDTDAVISSSQTGEITETLYNKNKNAFAKYWRFKLTGGSPYIPNYGGVSINTAQLYGRIAS